MSKLVLKLLPKLICVEANTETDIKPDIEADIKISKLICIRICMIIILNCAISASFGYWLRHLGSGQRRPFDLILLRENIKVFDQVSLEVIKLHLPHTSVIQH